MTPNEDALRCDLNHPANACMFRDQCRRLVAENEALANGRHELQAQGKHPAPCARFCESNAYEVEIRGLKRENEAQAALIRKQGRELGEQDALLQQALEALEQAMSEELKPYGAANLYSAIRTHREKKGEAG